MNKNVATLLAIAIMVPLVLVGLFLLQARTHNEPLPTGMPAGEAAPPGIVITAKGGYKPAKWQAGANMRHTIKIITKDTVDCSSALVIPDINYRAHLPMTGVTEIVIPPQPAGKELVGTCEMGMYRFSIKFVEGEG